MDNGSGGTDEAAFAQSLSALKDRGSNLLVVGAAIDGAHREACDRLLGEATGEPRRRVFVRTDGAGDCGLGVPPGASPVDTRVVEYATETRSAAVATNPGTEAHTTRIEDGRLDGLATAVVDDVDELAETSGDPEPAELRLCFDSLMPLLAEHDLEEVSRTLDSITARIREYRGMGHYHLPVDPDDRAVRLLEPLFDAVIELRLRDGRVDHNWRLVGRDVESGWLPL